MNTHYISRSAGIMALALLAGCGNQAASSSSLSGTYGSPNDQGSITFHADGSVLLNVGGQQVATTYTVASGKVEIKPPAGAGGGENMRFSIDNDGCLHGDLGGMNSRERICKND